MKATQLKDAVRNIRKQFISFLSILLVVALGVGIFLACNFGSRAIGNRANEVYHESAYRDIEIRTTRGVTEEDVEAVRNLSGVADVEPLFTVDLVAQSPTAKRIVHVCSRTERMDEPWVREGRLPEAADECALDRALMEQLGLALGDEMTLRPMDATEISPFLYGNTFRITGIITHPDLMYRFAGGNPTMLLSRAAFDAEGAGMENTGLLIRMNTDAQDTFSKEYQAALDETLRSLGALGRERAQIRDDQIKTEAQEVIAEGEEALASGKAELDSGRKELDDNSALIADAQMQLQQVRTQLEQGKLDLDAAEKELQNNKKKLDDAEAQLDAANAQLNTAKAQLDAGATELDAGKAQLDAAQAELAEADALLTEKRQELSEAKTKLDIARTTLDAAKQEINEGRDKINAEFDQVWYTLPIEEITTITPPHLIDLEALTENYTLTFHDSLHKYMVGLDFSEETMAAFEEALEQQPLWQYYSSVYDQIPNGEVAYAEGMAAYEEGSSQLQAAEEEYRAGLEEYNNGRLEYEQKYAEYEAGRSEYNVSRRLYETNLASYQEGMAQYEAGLAQFEEAKKKLEEGEVEYSAKEQEMIDADEKIREGEKTWQEEEEKYEQGLQDLEAGKEQLAAYRAGNWILMDRDLNMTWHELSQNVRSFRMLGFTFATLFVLLGILVCYATIGKIIDEQRKLVGTTKALGFEAKEIRAKYMLFGVLAAILGCLAGIALSYFLLERMILAEFENAIDAGRFPPYFSLPISLAALAISILVAAVSTWIACRRLLAQPARELMSGEIPPTMVEKKGRKPKRTSLYRSLILRNIRTDIKRVLVTVVSIAGCCILLIIGFSFKYSFTTLIERQYEQIQDYDAIVKILPDRAENVRNDMREKIAETGTEYVSLYQFGSVMYVGADQELVQVVCGDPDSLMRVYRLEDVRKNKEMRMPDGGVVIFNRLAETYHLEVGDHVSLLDEEGVYHDAPIAGIYNSYASRTVFLSRDYARELFGERAEGNAFALRLEDTDDTAMEKALSEGPGFLQYDNAEMEKKRDRETARAMDTVIMVMVVMAGIMAAVVLLNLLRIQINQKKRELTIMRVNGFTVKETVGYILRENILTTLAGIVIGLVVGNIITQFNLRVLERVELQMVRDINFKACLYSALITLLFAAIMNFLALRSIRTLKLSDVND